jgi:hypothetical protein
VFEDEDLRDLYSSPSIIRIFSSRKKRYEENVKKREEEECAYISGRKASGKETTRKTKM